ncbi:hypothetical protein ACK3YP_02095 [Aeromonas allosaccharophila]|uniref:hypothetical protein n=1 Tax=Aeromonas allosaccharophila TaxID=656 RepID=UPI003987B30A
MKPESSTRDKLKEYRSKQRQEISQKLAHSETYKVIGQMPPACTFDTTDNHSRNETTNETQSETTSSGQHIGRNEIHPSYRETERLEHAIEKLFFENRDEINELFKGILKEDTDISYKVIYEVIKIKIDSNETSEITSKLADTGNNDKHKKPLKIVTSIFLLIHARKQILEKHDFLCGLINVSRAYSMLINPDEEGNIKKALSILESVQHNAQKGGRAKAAKTLAVVKKAIELINEKRPNGGYKSRSTAIDIIENDLLEYIRIHMPNLKESNYKERTDEWFKKHPELQLALQLPPEKQKKRTSK